jgi:hypothetical protein
MRALAQDMLQPELNFSCKIEFTYSAMHGVGYPYMVQAFKAANFKVRKQLNITIGTLLNFVASVAWHQVPPL